MVQAKNTSGGLKNVSACTIVLRFCIVQDKNRDDGLKKCLFICINFQCGGSKYTTDVVEDLN